MPPRKRRRSRAFPMSDGDERSPQDNDMDAESDTHSILEKEREIWDSFREEHYEAIEQLPLTLHRQLSLMQQLDEQASGYSAALLPTLQNYIDQRRKGVDKKLASYPISESPVMEFLDETAEVINGASRLLASSRFSNTSGPSIPLKRLHLYGTLSPRTPTPMGIPPERSKTPETTPEMLSHIAWLSEELLRASQEKVNLAQAAHDSVDRHIRLIDQAIKEQEVSIASQTGADTLPILLPELVVPRWGRSARVSLSPIVIDEADAGHANEISVPELNMSKDISPSNPLNRAGKGVRGRRKLGPDHVERGIGRGIKSLKITLPAALPSDVAVDLNECVYCYCQRISFGQMIGCDNDNCDLEWFHLECVGLSEPPRGKWYCTSCRKK